MLLRLAQRSRRYSYQRVRPVLISNDIFYPKYQATHLESVFRGLDDHFEWILDEQL